MSWDVLFQDLPRGVGSIGEIPDDFVPQPLCTRAELVEKVRAVVPDADFRDPTWGHVEGEGYSIEINVGDDDPVEGFMLHVRGGDAVLGVIHDLARALGVTPIDCSEGELIDFESPDAIEGLRAWREFRDQVVGGREP